MTQCPSTQSCAIVVLLLCPRLEQQDNRNLPIERILEYLHRHLATDRMHTVVFRLLGDAFERSSPSGRAMHEPHDVVFTHVVTIVCERQLERLRTASAFALQSYP